MRVRDLFTEAWRNVATGAARPLTTALLVLIPVGALVTLETTSIDALERSAADFRSEQSAVFVLNSTHGVSGTTCDNLTSVQGVAAAGALRATGESVVPVSTPKTQIPLFEATRSFGRFISADLDRGVAVEQDVASAYRLGGGSLWQTKFGALPVGGAYPYPDDGRNPQLQFGVVGLGEDGVFDQCWVETWPLDERKSILLFSALTSGADPATATVTQLNPRNGTDVDARSQFATRPGRFAAWLAFLWSSAAVLGVSRLRRLELAFARHLGARRQELALLALAELLVWALPLAGISAAFLAALSWAEETTVQSAWHGAVVVAVALAGSCTGAAMVGLVSREKDLFAFFKHRS